MLLLSLSLQCLLYAHKFAKGENAFIEGNIGIEFGDESIAQSFRTGIRGMQHNKEGVYALTPLRKGVNALFIAGLQIPGVNAGAIDTARPHILKDVCIE